MKANTTHLYTIRRAIRLAQDEHELDLPIRTDIANKLVQKTYTRTRDRLEANRVARVKH